MKKLFLLFMTVSHIAIAQTYKMEVLGSNTENTEGLKVELQNPTSLNNYNAAIRGYNQNTGAGWGIRAGSASALGSGVQGTSTVGFGVTGYTGAPSVFGLYFPNTGTNTNSGVLGLGAGSYIGVMGFSNDGVGGFFSSYTGNIPLIIKKIPSLASNITNSMYFQTGDYYTGAIKTIGTSAISARLGLFTSSETSPTSLLERMSILDNGLVGIGITNPTATFEVVGATGSGTAAFKGSSWYSHFNYGINEDTYIRGGKNGANVLINDLGTLGNVGIGTSSPAEKLHVVGGIRSSNLAGAGTRNVYADANGTLTTAQQTRTLMLSQANFVLNSNDATTYAFGYSGSTGVTIYNSGINNSSFASQLILPHGAIVTNVSFYYTDQDAGANLQFQLYRTSFADNSSFLSIVNINTLAQSGLDQVISTNTNFSIDETKVYQLTVANTTGDWSPTLRFKGVKITYTL